MFNKVVILKAQDHASIKVADTKEWRFATREMVCPIAFNEMADAAREFLIFFMKGKPGLYSLLGVDKDTNAYVAANGKWLGRYKPARLRAYPFALIANQE